MELSGCGTALVTPFRADGGVDEPALHRLVEWQIASGIDFLIACGTTSEAPTLNEAESLRVTETIVGTAAGRVPVFAGCTHNATREAVIRARKLAQVPGLAGLLCANPYYNRPGQEGQYLHFRAVAEATPLPLILYNIPPRTGANLEPATVLRLAEIPNIIAIKESSGNIPQITELITQLPRSFKIFSGDDVIALPTLALGAVGLISVASNALPAEITQMVRAALTGDWETARTINRKFYRFMQALFWEPSPAPVKAVMALLGHGPDYLRLPMVPVTSATRRKLELLVGELGLFASAPPSGEDLRMF
jgi:4-hydroxy-tetrahydrodipicolinate synthase